MVSSSLSIAVLGDIAADWIVQVQNLDQRIADLQQEATGAINERLGGGGLLFASAAAAIGLNVSLIGRVGNDISGRAALDWLLTKGINCAVSVDNSFSTGRSLILRDEVRDVKAMVSHRGANVRLRPENVSEEVVVNSCLIYISGYSLLEAPQSSAALRAIEIARSHRVVVMVDLVPHRVVASGLSRDYRRAIDQADALVLELGTARRLLDDAAVSEQEALDRLLEIYSAVVVYPSNDVQIVATRAFAQRANTGYSGAKEKTGYLDKYRAEAVRLIAESNCSRDSPGEIPFGPTGE